MIAKVLSIRRLLCCIWVVTILFNITTTTGCRAVDKSTGNQVQTIYYCPMHPDYTANKQGSCPICGMDLIAKPSQDQAKSSAVATCASENCSSDPSICVMQNCPMQSCSINVNVELAPGEKFYCNVCGEAVGNDKLKKIQIQHQHSAGQVDGQKAITSSSRKILYYRNSMNPAITSPVPQKDSMGMDFIPVYEQTVQSASSKDKIFTVSSVQQQLLGVQVASVNLVNFNRVIRTSGKIAYDPELAVAQEEFRQSAQTEKQLKQAGRINDLERAQQLTQASRNKLRLMGLSEPQINNLLSSNQDNNLYLPAVGEPLWGYLSVYEKDLGSVHTGQAVSVEASAYPGLAFNGVVKSMSPVIDPTTRTIRVRVLVNNRDNKLKPEMYITGALKVDLGRKLAVPASAVMDTGVRKVVFVVTNGTDIAAREVNLGEKNDSYYVVIAGLNVGETVVVNGTFLIDSEAKLKLGKQ